MTGDNSYISYPGIKNPWPSPLAPEALLGLAGEVVNTILPHTEADQVALLLNFIVSFSSLIGRKPHFLVSGVPNPLNMFGVIVGATSAARKGTSWGVIKEIIRAHDSEWQKNNLASGLSSGEGLIWRVRDPIVKMEPRKESGSVIGHKEVIDDPGISDKRLLVVEGEFSRVLKSINREGNILSVIIRESFDSGDISTLTKNSPAKSTGASISIIGHITETELRKNLHETEAANGFANRFLWVCVKQSKFLPEGGDLHESEKHRLGAKLKEVVEFARDVEAIVRTTEAKKVWNEAYRQLGKSKPGMYGAITGRAQAQVARLSCIYALLEKSIVVEVKHLMAALALWDYVDASIRYIFGTRTGSNIADSIVKGLEENGELNQTQISDLLGRNSSSDEIANAISLLIDSDIIKSETEQTAGRPRTIFKLRSEDQEHEINELRGAE